MTSRRQFIHELASVGAVIVLPSKPGWLGIWDKPPHQLPEIFTADYPRSFFFRRSETLASSGEYSYSQWEKICSGQSGIMGKALDEEIPGLSNTNIDFFRRFKKQYPGQIVLLHYNGNARDPVTASQFFAGHWIYYEGCKATQHIPAVTGATRIVVENAKLFKKNIGRYGNLNEDIGICALGNDGKPDWHYSEQVKLLDVDPDQNVITVQRACYNTRPKAFKAGSTWLAAHVSEGPWGPVSKKPNLLWYYNHSLLCPKDKNGKTCNDILVKEMGSLFGSGGALENFDGIEFDVLLSEVTAAYPLGERQADTDADGKPDNGIVNGINEYSAGIISFCRALRKTLPKQKLILADSFKKGHQRAFNIINGIESEGWPSLGDPRFRQWSSGVNRMLFWSANCNRPSFNFINHKWGERAKEFVTPGSHRVVMAIAQCVDAAITCSTTPEPEANRVVGIWDELVKGTEQKNNWLGKPVSDTRRLALYTDDLLNGEGKKINEPLFRRIQAKEGTHISSESGEIKLYAARSERDKICFSFNDIPVSGPDLVVSFKIRGNVLEKYPSEIGRELSAGISDDPSAMEFISWFNNKWFNVVIYYTNIKPDTTKISIDVEIEGNEPVYINNLTAHAFPDAMVRDFEYGAVLINPSGHDLDFNLNMLFPDTRFKRLSGSSQQDPSFNNGSEQDERLTLSSKDAIFLIKQNV